jgi:Fungal Zn(2)-Cys(6) binuclear cluster domain
MSTISPQQPFNTTYAPGSPINGTSSRKVTPPQQPQHKRVYQACIPCRRRKVKCDLGSVDNPSDPPCVRCRRESKECYFSATRRKRKLPCGEDSVDGHGFDEEYLKRNGRKRLYSSDSGSEPPASLRQQSVGAGPFVSRPLSYADGNFIAPLGPLTPGGHIGRNQPLRRPHQSVEEEPQQGDKITDDSNVQYENPEAQDVMRREVYGPHDALDLLYKAATDKYVGLLAYFESR